MRHFYVLVKSSWGFAARNIEALWVAHGEELCLLPADVMDELVRHQSVPLL